MSAATLSQDPAVPARDLLLDEEAMTRRLGRLLGRHGPVTIDACRRRRVKYRPADSLRVLYEVEIDGRRQLIALRTFGGGRSERILRRATAHATDRGPLRGVARDAELGTVLFAFPNDRKIAGLPRLVEDPRPAVAASRLVAWAPEKCATVCRIDADGRTVAYAKAYAGEEGARTRRVHNLLRGPAAAAGVRLPWAISYDPERRVLECEAVDGTPLAELDGAELTRGLRRLGAALAALHQLDPPPRTPSFARVDPPELRRAAAVIGALRPDCAGVAHDLAERLFAEPPARTAPVCLHGDVHPKNALLGRDGLALIDLDQVAVGQAAADIGGILAGLRYRRLVGDLDPEAERAHAEAVLGGYAEAGGVLDPGAVRWHLAAALLVERCLRAITRVRPTGLARLPDLLATANAVALRASEMAA